MDSFHRNPSETFYQHRKKCVFGNKLKREIEEKRAWSQIANNLWRKKIVSCKLPFFTNIFFSLRDAAFRFTGEFFKKSCNGKNGDEKDESVSCRSSANNRINEIKKKSYTLHSPYISTTTIIITSITSSHHSFCDSFMRNIFHIYNQFSCCCSSSSSFVRSVFVLLLLLLLLPFIKIPFLSTRTERRTSYSFLFCLAYSFSL